jgi:hypothetical protein
MENSIRLTHDEAAEIHGEIKNSTLPAMVQLRKELEAKFPELTPKIADKVKTVNDADVYAKQNLGADYNWHGNKATTFCLGEKQQKAIYAFAQLSRLAHVLNEGWQPNWDNDSEPKHRISSGQHGLSVKQNTIVNNCPAGLYFKTFELAQHALEHNKQLFKELFGVE